MSDPRSSSEPEGLERESVDPRDAFARHLADIERARADAAVRVINGGMRENLRMAQILAAEDVVIAELNRLQALIHPERANDDPLGSEEGGSQESP